MKIRSIRPEFFADPTMAELTYDARLLYVGLWCYVDDDGRGEWLPKQIDGQIFPLESVDIHALLEQLVRTARVIRYSDGDRQYFYIPTFGEYQKPNRKYDSKLPDPAEYGSVEPKNGQAVPKQRVRSADAHAVEGEVEVEGEGEGVREPKGSRSAGNERTELFEAFYQAWHQRPYDSDTKLTKSERGRINAAVKEALDLAVVAEEVLTRARRYRQEWPAIELTPQALMSNWTRFDKASEPPPPFDPATCEHPEERIAEIEGDVYCGACGKEIA